MKVDNELIEKYHRGECTPAEAAAVEAWLLNDESDDLLELPASEDLDTQRQEIWSGIVGDLADDDVEEKTKPHFLWYKVAAACVFIFIVAFFGLHKSDRATLAGQVEVDNTTAEHVRHWTSSEYMLYVGPGTLARIDNREGIIHFKGSIIIRPQRDLEFSFRAGGRKRSFKSGETYILLDEEHGDGPVTIVNERNLADIPPVLQKRIIAEFKI